MDELDIIKLYMECLNQIENRTSLFIAFQGVSSDVEKFYHVFTRLSPYHFYVLLSFFQSEKPITGDHKRTFAFSDAFLITVMRIVSPARLVELTYCLYPMFGKTDESLLSTVITNFHARFTVGKRDRLLQVFLLFLKRRKGDYIAAFQRKGSPFVPNDSIGAVVALVDGTLLRYVDRPWMVSMEMLSRISIPATRRTTRYIF